MYKTEDPRATHLRRMSKEMSEAAGNTRDVLVLGDLFTARLKCLDVTGAGAVALSRDAPPIRFAYEWGTRCCGASTLVAAG